MVSNPGNRWAVAAGTFALWGLVAASAVYWGFKLGRGPAPLQAAAAMRTPPPADPQVVARVLGAGPAPVAAAPALGSRFALLGVVSDRHHEGAALIAVDGKPAKPFKVGAAVDAGLVLQAVDARQARLGADTDGPATITLELPVRPGQGPGAQPVLPSTPSPVVAPPNQRAATAPAR